MKKKSVIAAAAAALMLSTTLLGTAMWTSAQNEPGKNPSELLLSSCEDGIGVVWHPGGGKLNVSNDCTEGKGSIRTTMSGGNIPAIEYYLDPVDVSDYDYLEFDWYVTDASIVTKAGDFDLEITSDRDSSIEGYMQNKTKRIGRNTFKNATITSPIEGKKDWYHVKVALPKDGSLDLPVINKFRFFSVNAPAGTADIDIGFDNLKVTKETQNELVISNCDSGIEREWHPGGGKLNISTDCTEGTGSIRTTMVGGNIPEILCAFEPINPAGFDYLEFDWYISDTTVMDKAADFDMAFVSDRDSNKGFGIKEKRIGKVNLKNATLVSPVEGKKDWYHVKAAIPKDGSIDLAAFNKIRFFSVGCPSGTPDVEVGFDNVRLTKADPYTVALNAEEEIGILWHPGGGKLYADTDDFTEGTGSIKTIMAGGNIHEILGVVNGQPWNAAVYDYIELDFYCDNMGVIDAAKQDFDMELTSDRDNNQGGYGTKVWRLGKSNIKAATPVPGKKDWYHVKAALPKNGALNLEVINKFRFFSLGCENFDDVTVGFDNIMFTKRYAELPPPAEKPVPTTTTTATETTTTESTTTTTTESTTTTTGSTTTTTTTPSDPYPDAPGMQPVSNCETGIGLIWHPGGGVLNIDTENFTEGKGSIGALLGNSSIAAIEHVPEKAYDLRPYRYFKIDAYLDNTDFLTSGEVCFELGSARQRDKDSIRFDGSAIKANMAPIEGKTNWYTISLPIPTQPELDASGMQVGKFDLSKFNYLRFWSVNQPKTMDDLDLRFDNIRLEKEGYVPEEPTTTTTESTTTTTESTTTTTTESTTTSTESTTKSTTTTKSATTTESAATAGSSTTNTTSKPAPETGDSTMVVSVLGIAALAGVTVLVSKKRK